MSDCICVCLKVDHVNWNDVYSAINVDVALNSFIRIFHGILDNVAPYKEMRTKSKTEPWMNADILAGIRCRNELFGKFKKNKDRADIYKQYCTVRNRVQRDIKEAKKFFFQNKVEQNRGDPKKLWSQLKSLGYDSKKC